MIVSDCMADSVTLILRDMAIKQFFDMATLASTLNVDQHREIEMNRMAVILRASVLAEELVTDEKTFEFTFDTKFPVYRGWWQHFKGEVFPDWLKKKFPPQFNYVYQTHRENRTVDFTKYATYPKATIAIRELGDVVYKYQINGDGFEVSPK